MLMKIISILAMSFLIYFTPSCDGAYPKEKEVPKEGQSRIFAVVTDTNGVKFPTIVLRLITKSIKYDSLTKKDIVGVDTFYGVERKVPVLDSLKKPKLDSTGLPLFTTGYFMIGKDSVNTDVCNKPIDTLIKK